LSSLKALVAIWRKDMKSEMRTRYAINAILLFAFTTLIVISYSISPYRVSLNDRPFIYASLIWIVLVFSALSGLARSFVKESESFTEDQLRISTSPEAIFLGKLLFNVTVIFVLELLIVPVFILITRLHVVHPVYFILLLLSGGAGLCMVTTIMAAMIARARVKSVLFSAISFPLLFPLIITVIKGTEKSFRIMRITHWNEFLMSTAYAILLGVLAYFLFPLIWRD